MRTSTSFGCGCGSLDRGDRQLQLPSAVTSDRIWRMVVGTSLGIVSAPGLIGGIGTLPSVSDSDFSERRTRPAARPHGLACGQQADAGLDLPRGTQRRTTRRRGRHAVVRGFFAVATRCDLPHRIVDQTDLRSGGDDARRGWRASSRRRRRSVPTRACRSSRASRDWFRTRRHVPAKRAITVDDLLSFRLGFGVVMAPPGTYPIQVAEDELQLKTLGPPWPPTPHHPDEWMRLSDRFL